MDSFDEIVEKVLSKPYFKNNKWYSTKVFALSKNGWSIPDYMIGKVNDLQLGKSG
jgi:hypothetical protein